MINLKNVIVYCFFTFFVISNINAQTKKINGVSLVSSNDSIQVEQLLPIKNIHANFVAVSPFGFVKDLNEPQIYFNTQRQWFGETSVGIKQYINLLKSQKIRVMLKPQLWVGHGKYTGFIEMQNEQDWKAIENSYSKFILNYARLAQELNVELFCIGTELMNFVKTRPSYWNSLIIEIRKIYKGKLTYAANWDEFDKISIWKDLDIIGIDAYFPLSEKKNPSVSEIEKGWKAHKKSIEQVVKITKKPVLFTEFGYRSIDFSTKEPWSSDRKEGEVNLLLQSSALQALFNQFWGEKWFLGGFMWKWYANHNIAGGVSNNRFTPQNKPAENTIKKQYLKYLY